MTFAGGATLRRSQALLGCVALAGVSLLLQGCGGDRDEPVAPVPIPEETTTTTVTSTENVTEPTTVPPTTEAPTTTSTTTTTTTEDNGRAGSFIVLGDWGWDPEVHGQLQSRQCQQAIADAMDEKMRELGDVKFVVNVGDSFYPGGAVNKTDSNWDSKWRDVYTSRSRSVPWYSVYGNHDYLVDPCSCSLNTEDCAQINDDITNLDYFYMPDSSYIVDHPELGLEVVALDMNYYTWVNHTCQYTSCEETCHEVLKARHDAAYELFYQRHGSSSRENLLVFSHYPTDYFWGAPDFLDALRDDSRHHIEYFGGHRHNVDQRSTTSIAPNNNWLVGGGGGWGCEGYGTEQGFVVGEIASNFTITTYSVLVNYSLCCGV